MFLNYSVKKTIVRCQKRATPSPNVYETEKKFGHATEDSASHWENCRYIPEYNAVLSEPWGNIPSN